MELGGGGRGGRGSRFPDAYALRDLPIVSGSSCIKKAEIFSIACHTLRPTYRQPVGLFGVARCGDSPQILWV